MENIKNVIQLMKYELGDKIMTATKFIEFRPKFDSYLNYNNDENKKTKDTKTCAKKFNLKIISIVQM